MLQQQVIILNNILLVVDAVCIIAAGYIAYFWNYNASGGMIPIESSVFYATMLSMMFINSYMMGKFGLYGDVKLKSYLSMSWAIAKSVFMDFAFLAAGLYFYGELDYSRNFIGTFALLTFGLMLLFRIWTQLYLDYWSPRGFHVNRILIVGDRSRGERVKEILEGQLSWGHEVVGRVNVGNDNADTGDTLGTLDELPTLLQREFIDEVVFALSGDRGVRIAPYLAYCRQVGMPVRILPALWDEKECSLSTEVCQGVPFLTMRTTNFNASGLLFKRMLDIAGGLTGTLLFLLMYPFMAVAIKLDTPGPVLFKQKRMGQHGRVFKLMKFRTMVADAEARKKALMEKNQMNGAIFKLDKDPRITRVGRFLRNTSLDEFPQFINVLIGQMSLVGTRPPTLDEVEKYKPEHLKRISAKPGITGLWQVSGRNKVTDFDKIVELDCQYLDHWRFFHDLKILAKTILVVLQRKGAI